MHTLSSVPKQRHLHMAAFKLYGMSDNYFMPLMKKRSQALSEVATVFAWKSYSVKWSLGNKAAVPAVLWDIKVR